jgi:hypothetical protein
MRTVREASREIRSTVGLDELMRDDPPRPMYRPPPPATVARLQAVPSATEANVAPAADAPAEVAAGNPLSPSSAAVESPAPTSDVTSSAAPALDPARPPADPDKAGA